MIEAEHSILISAAIEDIWEYVRQIEKWANLFPGCRDCEVLDQDDSRWTIKIGAGGLVKTVNALVHVEEWSGPGRVNFSFRLEVEPVVGSGTYSAQMKSDGETEITMSVRVEGSGSMAPMWEAVSKPLLPQLARTFASRLKSELEEVGIAVPVEVRATTPSMLTRIRNGLRKLPGVFRNFFRGLFRGR